MLALDKSGGFYPSIVSYSNTLIYTLLMYDLIQVPSFCFTFLSVFSSSSSQSIFLPLFFFFLSLTLTFSHSSSQFYLSTWMCSSIRDFILSLIYFSQVFYFKNVSVLKISSSFCIVPLPFGSTFSLIFLGLTGLSFPPVFSPSLPYPSFPFFELSLLPSTSYFLS